jgi:glycosyltransferase involved in cell wall biosynthesis
VRGELERAGIAADKLDVVPDGVSIPDNVIPYEERPKVFVGLMKEPGEWGALGELEVQFPSDLADDLPKSRGLLYLSRSEGLGSAALWAMAYATPVIASRIGGLVEVVEHGKTGFLVENEDPEGIRDALRKLRSDPQLASRMGLLGRHRVSQEFTIDRMVDRTIQIYEKVLNRAGRA